MVGGMPRYAATADVPFVADIVVDADASPASLKATLSGVDGLVVGGLSTAPALLDAAGDASVPHVVVVSSAVVYGAWPNNPVPLSEDAALRPNPGFELAARCAEAERLAAEWKDAHPAATVTVLRPTVTVRDGALSLLDQALNGVGGLRPLEASRPVQFLAEADLASAIATALEQRLDGAFNVAPDGWVSDETTRALAGGPTRFPLPERVARVLRKLWPSKEFPGIDPYQRNPWVVANDRLKRTGWAPTQTSEEAYVDVAAGRWPEIPPRRRQELALAVTGAAVAGAVAGVVVLVRRRRRRR